MALDPVVILIARALVVALFSFHAWDKLGAPREFALSVMAYRIVPDSLIPLLAWTLVALEISVVLGGALGVALAYTVAAALLLCYAMGMLVNLLRHRRYIDCGCGGPAQPISYALVARNAVLILVALVAAGTPTARALSLLDGFTVVVAVLCLSLLYAAINDLLAARALFDEAQA